MKYMGSKRAMLKNGLGQLLLEESKNANNIFDPFCGSSSVSWFLAEETMSKVFSGDLQNYSIDLANSILLRDKVLSVNEISILEEWVDVSELCYLTFRKEIQYEISEDFVNRNRKLSASFDLPITNAYGGYYFSLDQSLKFDSLLMNVPHSEPFRSLAFAGLIEAASSCVASPGHTAQPFQPRGNGLQSILDSWNRDPFFYVEKSLSELSCRCANQIGFAKRCNAIELLDMVSEDDLVFIDPPYSGVQYSRFYHVFETISNSQKIEVSGCGRYPDRMSRPTSDYSMRSKSIVSFEEMIKKVSQKNAKAIITFPVDKCSNGLSGEVVKNISKKYFKVNLEIVKGSFSTLGGNNKNRPARHVSEELILLLSPK